MTSISQVTTPDLTAGFTYTALPGRVVFSAGAARERLAGEVELLGMQRLLVVAGPRELDRSAALLAPLVARVAATFSQVREHVPVEIAQAARAAAADCAADGLLAIGGGSSTGTAKAVALTTGLPIIVVPTTYAGSEMTPVWGMTDGAVKSTGRDPRVLPRTVVYDPELTTSLPLELSVASGLNALAHCVEAFWAPGRNPVSSLSAAEAITALALGLQGLVQHGRPEVAGPSLQGHLEARAQVLYGAYLAGAAFAVAGSGLHHKICHVLGGAYRLPHAQLHAVVLPHVLAFTAPAVPLVAGRIAAALPPSATLSSRQAQTSPGTQGSHPTWTSSGTTDGAGDGDPAEIAVHRLVQLYRSLDAPRSLSAIGMPRDQLDDAARLVADVAPADHPRRFGAAEARALLEAAWEGQDPTVEGGRP